MSSSSSSIPISLSLSSTSSLSSSGSSLATAGLLSTTSPPPPTTNINTSSKISPLKGALNRVKNIPSSLKPSNLITSSANRTKSKSPNRLPQPSNLKLKSVPSIDLNNAIGMCSIEINRATGLPYWKAVTRLSFDMDPFVIISFGKKVSSTS
ncbi:hypothetical protein PGTUg99_003622 [Puccinia graminis f. sp. tritici]|uniref:Uncharacterized protein n=1 Tax=Puccinia graminis f. sp. tritici TaxID=56615 RepID=A0A5B0R5S9_PUCGR|nr:hypothetical protein PGTUg99_003622 [Puccinia graminis f. sp. tritici]